MQVSCFHSGRSIRDSRLIKFIGHGNRISPVALPYRYNVLDWFHVTDVWCEKSPFARWMVRLEKINLAEKSWWSPKSDPDPSMTAVQPKALSETCSACQKSSKAIYVQGWVCLNTGCREFFNYPASVDLKALEYVNEFLAERTKFQGVISEPLRPQPCTQEDLDKVDLYGVEEAFKRGIVCPQCNCCARRLQWSGWTCENTSCGWFVPLKPKPMPIDHVLSNNLGLGDRHLTLCPTLSSSVRRTQRSLGLYTVYDFTLTGESGEDIGMVRLIKSDAIINQQKDGANDMFQEMQLHDFYLKRNPVRAPNSKQ